jgi:hypothetical protein
VQFGSTICMPAIIVDMLSGQLMAPAAESADSANGAVAVVVRPDLDMPDMPGMPGMLEPEDA